MDFTLWLLLITILLIFFSCVYIKNSFNNKTIKFHKREDRMGSLVLGMLRIVLPNIEDNTILYDSHTTVGDSARRYASNSVFEDFMQDLANMPQYNVHIYKKGDKYDIDMGRGPDMDTPFLYKQYSPEKIKELRLNEVVQKHIPELHSQYVDKRAKEEKIPRSTLEKEVQENIPVDLKALGLIDISTRLKEIGLKDVYYNTYRKRASKERWELPKGPYTLIHYRLEDMTNRFVQPPMDYQRTTNKKTLVYIIEMMKQRYPNNRIYIMTTKPDFNLMEKILKETNQRKHVNAIIGSSSRDYDKDLWIMMNSDILLTSMSTFPMVSAFLHQGRQVYALPWNHIYSSNIFTEVDKSGWIRINELF